MCNRDCPQFDPPLPTVWGQAPSRYHPSVRLAVFTPLPPTRSGIADYAVELLHELGSRHQIQVYVASTQEVSAWTGRGAPFTVHGAHDFVWTHHREPYELVIFQIGNAWCHDYMWPYVFRYPGLVVLHDAQLHHARAWSLLRRARTDDYRAELAFNHPGLAPEAAEPAISGFGGPLYYAWPMLRAVVSSARHVAVHNPVLADDFRRDYSETPINAIRMGVRQPATTGDAIATIRTRHGIASDAIVLVAFGGVADEKRIGPLLNAVSVARAYEPRIRVLLVGQALPHYDALSIARDLGLDEIVTGTGYVPDHEVGTYLAAADIVSCLRWPTARETSASWLRAIAAGRATIVTDLADQAGTPTLDPRSWTVLHATPGQTTRAPIAVSIDVLDEDHSLTLAVKRLTADRTLRERLGVDAQAYWRANHTIAHMAADYETLLAGLKPRRHEVPLPAHLRPDGLEHARALLAPFGDTVTSTLA
jgi:glycosyltransferase involved in cell wall biosynthesis